jgi:tetratricopeptide (TPR) repeat protein
VGPAGITTGLNPHEFLLLPAVFLAPLAVAAVHPPVVAGFSTAIVAAFALFVAAGARFPTWAPARALAAVLLAGCAIMLVQSTPLPQGLLAALSPRAFEIVRGLRANAGIDAPATISLDPPATGVDLLKACACLMTFVMAAAAGEQARRRLLATIALSGFAVVLVGVFQKLAGAREILGLYPTAAFDSAVFVSTFVNPNHLAGYLGLSSCVSIGLGVGSVERSRRVLFVFVGAITGAGVFLSLSRGGMVAFAAAQFFLLFLLLRQRICGLGRATWWQAGFALALAVAAWLAYAEIARELSTISSVKNVESDAKLQSFKDAARMAAAFWPAGAGRGAYEGAINMFRKPGHVSWTHAENEYIQAAADMGLPYAAVLLGAMAFLFAALFASRRAATNAGILSGVYMLVLHNFVDFNLEVLSVALAFFAVLGAGAAGPAGSSVVPESRGRTSAPGLLTLLLGAVAVSVAIPAAGRDLRRDTVRLKQALSSGGISRVTPEVREILCRHKADYFLPLVTGAALMNARNADLRAAHGMVKHAMFLNPVAHEPHLLSARLFEQVGNTGQAMAEYRQAVRLHPPILQSVLLDLQKRDSSLEFLSRAVPEDPGPMLGLAEFLRARGRSRDAVSVLRDLLVLFPEHKDAAVALAGALASAGEADEAARYARAIIAGNPGKADGYRLLADVESKAGRAEEARSLLKKALAIDRFDTESLVRLGYLCLAARDLAEARLAARTIFLAPDGGRGNRAQAHMLLAVAAEIEGRRVEALSEYRRARDLSPGDTAPIWGIARMHEAMQEHAAAIDAYRTILRLRPGDKEAAARLSANEKTLGREVEKAKEMEYLR